ncbi:MAG: molybdopterin molybdotransferase MoeA [Nevskiaceae bacterium]|nr:molybdopterin molybdotransferase MoeA [Nevskiaceae bacterium]
MLTPAEAAQRIGQHLPVLPVQSLPIGQCVGAILRENIYAERDQPPFDRVSMDGIAVCSAHIATGSRRLRIAGTQAAGDPPLSLPSPDQCIEAMTGAVLPSGCDAVVPVEHIRVEDGFALINDNAPVEPRQNVHARGTDRLQGALLLTAGSRLQPPDVAVAAGAGMAHLRVSAEPACMVISTGNELVEPGEPIESWQLRRSNVYALTAALQRRGFTRVVDDHLPDDADVLQQRLAQHLNTHDVLILSGGVSMGRFDLVPAALAACGVRQVFHKVAQRPGKPFWFGVAPRGNVVFALPGNPVSTLVCLARYVIPALDRAMGAQSPQQGEKIALGADIAFKPALAGFIPVRVQIDDSGQRWAQTVTTNGSGDFAALAGTEGFVELPPGPNNYAKGFVTALYRW